MTVIEPHVVYLDDSGSTPNARIIVAALCIAPIKRWRQFEAAWIAAEKKFGFKEFHMTEFAGCRKTAWCRDCKNGKTDATQHPWREWSNRRRHKVLAELIRIANKYPTQGFGIAQTKENIDKLLRQSKLQEVAPPDAFGHDYYTFAASTVMGDLAKWRKRTNQFPPLKLVFDGEHKLELARAFLSEHQVKPRVNEDGLENWFELGANGIAFESRKITRQLLAADMLAWVTAKIRVAELFPTTYRRMGGWGKEVSMVAFEFIRVGKLRIGHASDPLGEWLNREIAFWQRHNS